MQLKGRILYWTSYAAGLRWRQQILGQMNSTKIRKIDVCQELMPLISRNFQFYSLMNIFERLFFVNFRDNYKITSADSRCLQHDSRVFNQKKIAQFTF